MTWPAPSGTPRVAIRYAWFTVGHATPDDIGTADDPQRIVSGWRFWPADTPALQAANTSPYIERWTRPDWENLP